MILQVRQVNSMINLTDYLVIDLLYGKSLEIGAKSDTPLLMPDESLNLVDVHSGSNTEGYESMSETMHGLFKGSGDIEYTADNALVFLPDWDPVDSSTDDRVNSLWLVASRENSPGLVARYHLDYPYWGFSEIEEG